MAAASYGARMLVVVAGVMFLYELAWDGERESWIIVNYGWG